MPLQMLFPADSMTHEDEPLDTSPPPPASPSGTGSTARAEWLIAFAIVVATLLLVLLVIGPPHVM
jgi:hypothetical protein